MRLFVRGLAFASALLVAAAGTAGGQEGGAADASRPPQIVVSASHSVEVAADRAHLTVAVETRGRTSQLAASENAKIQTAVLAALKRTGIAAAQLRTQAITVTPEYEYPKEGGRPTVVGYQARNAVAVEIRDLAKIGQVIDAALASDATSISGPHFALASPDSARRVALALAVQKARADAGVMAEAAGVQLGDLLEMTSLERDGGIPLDVSRVAMMRSEQVTETPVELGTITVRASVTLRLRVRAVP
jgi:hypothetical protein